MVNRNNVLLALFNNRLEAEQVVDELLHEGFARENVGFAIRGDDAVRGGMITDAAATKDGSGAIKGAVTGGLAGGLLAAVATVVIPGVGPIIAGGVLASILGFAAAGTAVGGILGAMAGLELSEEEARFYEHQFNCGKALVYVKAGSRAADAGQILKRHGGFDMHNCPADTVPAQSHASSHV